MLAVQPRCLAGKAANSMFWNSFHAAPSAMPHMQYASINFPNASMMNDTRQKAFSQLRGPCVELSQTALKFRGKQATIKNVLQSLQKVHLVLGELSQKDILDAKLAEYAFFPLSHVFNESQRLSAQCVQIAVRCLQILVAKGWRDKIAPEMGKQLLMLMSLLAGGPPNQTPREPPPNELQIVCYEAVDSLVEWLSKSAPGQAIFDDASSKNIVDQTVYLLLEAITENGSDQIQLTASKALFRQVTSINKRTLLASLLPRTVSGLTRALRPSVKARRTYNVLETNIRLLSRMLWQVLRDEVSLPSKDSGQTSGSVAKTQTAASAENEILDKSWLQATSSQVQIALINVMKLRYHERIEVRDALEDMCLMIIKECRVALHDSIAPVLETLVVLASQEDSPSAFAELKYLTMTERDISDLLKASLHNWSQSLPRLMQGSEDRPKQRAIEKISTTFNVLAVTNPLAENVLSSMAMTLVNSVAAALQVAPQKSLRVIDEIQTSPKQILDLANSASSEKFLPVVLNHKSQEVSTKVLSDLIVNLHNDDCWKAIALSIIKLTSSADHNTQTASIWLALNLLQSKGGIDIDDILVETPTSDGLQSSRPYLISELYSYTLPLLDQDLSEESFDWQLKALALECVVLQATQLGESYRPELIETLYPIVSLLGSRQEELRQHAVSALNYLAIACGYESAKMLLVENVDYLVNSIALKLNASNLSPQAPQILLMMVRLCGATLLPYLDDLISSIFTMLDDHHGYPDLVESLFEVLRAMVDESAKQSQLAIADADVPDHSKQPQKPSTLDDTLSDIAAAKSRKRKTDEEHEERVKSFPRKPWSSLNKESGRNEESESTDLVEDGEEGDLTNTTASNDDKGRPLSKSHKLLLSIAQSTTPHLSSPSPAVRLTLLQLLHRITPILTQDENSFLPLINAVWPSVVDRLFSEVGVDGQGEAAYNICMAAETAAKLCEGAGDFMSGRIEDIFSKLEKLYKHTWKRVRGSVERRTPWPNNRSSSKGVIAEKSDSQIVRTQIGELANAVPSLTLLVANTRTADTQILNSLVSLFVSVLKHVRIKDDHGEALLALLSPIMDETGRDAVRDAVETWNEDAVWLVRKRRRVDESGLGDFRMEHGPGFGSWDLESRPLSLREVIF